MFGLDYLKATVRSIRGGKTTPLRYDRCDCGYAEPVDPWPKRAERRGNEWVLERVEETDAATVEHYKCVFAFRCVDCGEVFTYEPSFATKTETTFYDEGDDHGE